MSEEKTQVELSSNAKQVLELVEKLSVLDLANLVKAMEEKFGVSAAMPMAAMAAPLSASGGAGAVAEEAPSHANVELSAAGSQKIAVIKAVRELTALGLKEAKDLVDGAPKMVKENVPMKDATEMKSKLEAAGATVTFK